MSARGVRLAALWGGFLAAHALVGWLGWVLPHQAMGDVTRVYEPWAHSALTGGAIMGVTEPWVYPQLALVPMALAQGIAVVIAPIVGAAAYLIAWAVLVTALDAIAFGVLLGRRPSLVHRRAAWFWCAAIIALGPVGMYRIDAVTVPIALVAGLWIVRRPAVAAALFAIGAWIKIWPGALLAAAAIAARHRGRVLVAGGGVAVVIAAVLLGIGAEWLGFAVAQTGRGLQVEAVAATPFLWLAAAGGADVEYSFDILTFQVSHRHAEAVAALTLPALVLGVAAIAVVGIVAALRRASYRRLFPPLALTLVLALIVFNKVGSPQFMTWLFVPVMLWVVLDSRRAVIPAALTLALSGLTFLVYPVLYGSLLAAAPLPVVIVSVRNALLVALLVLCGARLVRVMRHPLAR